MRKLSMLLIALLVSPVFAGPAAAERICGPVKGDTLWACVDTDDQSAEAHLETDGVGIFADAYVSAEEGFEVCVVVTVYGCIHDPES